MGQPSVIFLDEPTSGLGEQIVALLLQTLSSLLSYSRPILIALIIDASSALLVMNSLKKLVEANGVTVCAVIHQVSTMKQTKEIVVVSIMLTCFSHSRSLERLFLIFSIR